MIKILDELAYFGRLKLPNRNANLNDSRQE